MVNTLKTTFVIAFVLLFTGANSSLAACKKKPSTCKITINASPRIVYDVIRNLRNTMHKKQVRELSKTKNHTMIEETFHVLPVIGKAVCVYKETYVPGKQISYHMVRSERFKAFEGKWLITKCSTGKTQLSLSSYVDAGMSHIPFAKQITRMETKKGIKKRLASVKKIAEKKQIAMAKRNTKKM